MDKQEIIKQLAQISKEFHDTQHKIITEHPGINSSKDTRVTVFTNSYIVLDSIYVCLIVRSYEIAEPDWWSKLVQENKLTDKPSIEALSDFLDGFNTFAMSAYLSLLSGAIEGAFRSFHKAVFPSDKIPIIFECVCENLLSDTGLGLSDYLELLKLLRNLRNALAHNNGVHTHDDDRASWNDVTIKFRKGQRVDLGESGWKVMFVLASGILDMLKKVVYSTEIIGEPLINDASYD
ncbi:MAG: hypothetical protein WCF23_00750 [Candidatus Nitrosopolaris sp.]